MQVACLLIMRLDMFVFSTIYCKKKKKMASSNSRRNGTCDMSDICSLTSYNFFFYYVTLYNTFIVIQVLLF